MLAKSRRTLGLLARITGDTETEGGVVNVRALASPIVKYNCAYGGVFNTTSKKPAFRGAS